MKEITELRDIQQIVLDILKDVHDVCVSNNIRYFIAFGTLIGAIRHKGFIPWDDDIDLYMPRKDYEKFIHIYMSVSGRNILYAQEINPDYLYQMAKLVKRGTLLTEPGCHCGVSLGVGIDIFPLDGVGDNLGEARCLVKKTRLYVHLLTSYRVEAYRTHISLKRNLLVIGAKVLAFILGKKFILKKMLGYTKRFDYDSSKYVTVITGGGIESIILAKLYFDKSVLVNFEGVEVCAPQGYNEILKLQYGDYMKLPPEDQRVPKHGFKAYLLNEGDEK